LELNDDALKAMGIESEVARARILETIRELVEIKSNTIVNEDENNRQNALAIEFVTNEDKVPQRKVTVGDSESEEMFEQPSAVELHASTATRNEAAAGDQVGEMEEKTGETDIGHGSIDTGDEGAVIKLEEVTVSSWGENHVFLWLKTVVKLPEYCELFLENGIGGRALLLFDDESLRAIGVKKMGDIMVILRAVRDIPK